ncbi:hypothetical protein LIER_37204 [Lithospermum erythrorhizon]|uniref:Protein FAR1-RELATED SEQUENCE n=1 Tax=Lithospermum erythrorhizon TaxID=34254 RepID=A0AAV3PJV9_LITER
MEIAIKNELPEIQYKLCVKHVHVNWGKRFSSKMLKNMMWKCVRAANEAYFEYRMQRLKNVTVEGYEALRRIDPRKWCRFAFSVGINCPELVNNWGHSTFS